MLKQDASYQLAVGADVIAVGSLENCQAAQVALSRLTGVGRESVYSDGDYVDSLFVVRSRHISVAETPRRPLVGDEVDATRDALLDQYEDQHARDPVELAGCVGS